MATVKTFKKKTQFVKSFPRSEPFHQTTVYWSKCSLYAEAAMHF